MIQDAHRRAHLGHPVSVCNALWEFHTEFAGVQVRCDTAVHEKSPSRNPAQRACATQCIAVWDLRAMHACFGRVAGGSTRSSMHACMHACVVCKNWKATTKQQLSGKKPKNPPLLPYVGCHAAVSRWAVWCRWPSASHASHRRCSRHCVAPMTHAHLQTHVAFTSGASGCGQGGDVR
jgi:hypothetical protein